MAERLSLARCVPISPLRGRSRWGNICGRVSTRFIGSAGYHACGTARMGGDDAVVDARLRVRGVSSLRVIDGSIMPTMVSANTNGPIMAVAWRAAELIRQEGKLMPDGRYRR